MSHVLTTCHTVLFVIVAEFVFYTHLQDRLQSRGNFNVTEEIRQCKEDVVKCEEEIEQLQQLLEMEQEGWLLDE